MSDTSIMGAIGQAMGQGAQGAMLGRVIGDLRDDVAEANDTAHEWRNYALKLQRKVDKLNEGVNSISDTATKTIEDYEKYTAQLKAASNTALEVAKEDIVKAYEHYAEAQRNSKKNLDHARANEAYGKALKFRLCQMEIALRVTSAEKIGLQYAFDSLEALLTRLNLMGELPDDLVKNVEMIRDKFIESEVLTDNPEVQKCIDEAPVPTPHGPVTF